MKLLLLLLISLTSIQINAQEVPPDTSSNPLQNFEFLIGGIWKGSNTQQTFEWGIGKKSVVSDLYFIEADTTRLVGEMIWFWHPGQKKIKGYATSIDMAMDFFDYTTSFESPTKMVNTYIGYGGHMDDVPQLEVLLFSDANTYVWTYYNKEGLEYTPAYSLTFKRSRK